MRVSKLILLPLMVACSHDRQKRESEPPIEMLSYASEFGATGQVVCHYDDDTFDIEASAFDCCCPSDKTDGSLDQDEGSWYSGDGPNKKCPEGNDKSKICGSQTVQPTVPVSTNESNESSKKTEKVDNTPTAQQPMHGSIVAEGDSAGNNAAKIKMDGEPGTPEVLPQGASYIENTNQVTPASGGQPIPALQNTPPAPVQPIDPEAQ